MVELVLWFAFVAVVVAVPRLRAAAARILLTIALVLRYRQRWLGAVAQLTISDQANEDLRDAKGQLEVRVRASEMARAAQVEQIAQLCVRVAQLEAAEASLLDRGAERDEEWAELVTALPARVHDEAIKRAEQLVEQWASAERAAAELEKRREEGLRQAIARRGS